MHFNLMDPKLIAGVVVIVLMIVVGVALYVRRQKKQLLRGYAGVWVRIRPGGSRSKALNTRQKRNWWIVRRGSKT